MWSWGSRRRNSRAPSDSGERWPPSTRLDWTVLRTPTPRSCRAGCAGALDVLTAANLRKELLSLWRQQKMPTRVIVMVTHNIDEAVSLADRILVLGADPGHIRIELAGLPTPSATRALRRTRAWSI